MSDPNRKEYSYSEKPNDSELIYRQDALDILEDFETCVYEATGGAYEKARKAMCELQSQPEKRTQERTETHACDSISRQAAIEAAIEAADDWDGGYSKERERLIRDALEKLPSAQPERKKGKWTIYDRHTIPYQYICSECGAYHRAGYDFCPTCGTDMRGEQK